jgi:peptidoglycan hydrolase-like protein with peptidoglycan-binding domain
MRSRLVALLLLVGLAAAACGGGGGGGSSTGLLDTGAIGTVATEAPPPPPPPAEAAPIQITVPKGQPTGPQSPAERVAELQKALIALGYKIGKPDGIYGGKTRKAVVKFQKAHKLDADGLVGAKTAKAINKALAKLATG